MTTTVEPDDAQAAAEQRYLGVPHPQVRPQRVHQHYRRDVVRPIDAVGETHPIGNKNVRTPPLDDWTSR